MASSPSRILLDTSAFRRLRSGDERVAAAIAAARSVALSVVTLGELEAGAQLGVRAADNRAALAEFLAAPFVSVLPITTDVARVYGRIFAELRRAGRPIGVNDIWIAAGAIESGSHLVTFDVDFRRVAGLDATILAVKRQTYDLMGHSPRGALVRLERVRGRADRAFRVEHLGHEQRLMRACSPGPQ